MNITNLRSKISEFALEQTQNKPKTRYCGHLFSHLSRVWTYPHPRVDLFSYMGGGGVPREEDGIQIMDGFWQGKGSWQVELACLRRIISCLGHWGGAEGVPLRDPLFQTCPWRMRVLEKPGALASPHGQALEKRVSEGRCRVRTLSFFHPSISIPPGLWC
jgi:hypothetical protein